MADNSNLMFGLETTTMMKTGDRLLKVATFPSVMHNARAKITAIVQGKEVQVVFTPDSTTHFNDDGVFFVDTSPNASNGTTLKKNWPGDPIFKELMQQLCDRLRVDKKMKAFRFQPSTEWIHAVSPSPSNKHDAFMKLVKSMMQDEQEEKNQPRHTIKSSDKIILKRLPDSPDGSVVLVTDALPPALFNLNDKDLVTSQGIRLTFSSKRKTNFCSTKHVIVCTNYIEQTPGHTPPHIWAGLGARLASVMQEANEAGRYYEIRPSDGALRFLPDGDWILPKYPLPIFDQPPPPPGATLC